MKALILAAGMGERLRPLTDVTPKPMLELGGHPLIHYPLAMLHRAGIAEVAINLHHLASVIQRGLGDGSQLGLHITYAPEPVLLGTGGPLNGLRNFLRDDTFVIANSDTILDLDLSAMLAFHRDRAALATIALFQSVLGALADGIDGAIPSLALSDTVKRVRDGLVTETLDRTELVTVQTPQAFRASVLRAAHATDAEATDDAALLERLGRSVAVVPGEADNLKLTSPADLEQAATMLLARNCT